MATDWSVRATGSILPVSVSAAPANTSIGAKPALRQAPSAATL
jgi:hypothetical protein